MTSEPPTPPNPPDGADEASIRFVLAALSNAHALVVDAEVLLAADRWARSHALATFAIEEAGKAWMANEHLIVQSGEPIKRVRHEQKLTAARQMAALYSSLAQDGVIDLDAVYSENHDYLADDDFFSRMTGLYVDLEDGEARGGHESIEAEQARETVALAAQIAHIAITLLWQTYGGS